MWGQKHSLHNSSLRNNLLLSNGQIINPRLNSEIFPNVSPVKTKEGSQHIVGAPLCMSSPVHTSVWLSNLPSPTHSAHTDTPSAGPDGPGCQRMKGGGEKEWEEERVWEKGSTTGSKDTSTSRFFISNNNQPPGGAVSQEHPHGLPCSFIWISCSVSGSYPSSVHSEKCHLQM